MTKVDSNSMSYIGEKKIKGSKETGETTPGGIPLVAVNFADGSIEYYSKLMFDETKTNKAVDLTELRDMRVQPIVSAVLALVRDWGLKIGETPYFGQMLNQSLNYNVDQAELELWGQWMPKPKHRDEVSLTDVDRVLKSKQMTIKDVLSE